MEFNKLHVLILCVCLGQMCTASKAPTFQERNKIRENVQNAVHGVGEQFIDDMLKVLEQSPTNPEYIGSLYEGLVMVLKNISSTQENKKIDVKSVKDFIAKSEFYIKNDTSVILKVVDNWKIIQSIWSKELPPERYNGIFNLCFMFFYPDTTSEEIESALNYLYGVDTEATKISFMDSHNIRSPTPDDCPEISQEYLTAVDELKSMIDIKPKVFEDFTAIYDKFPCNFVAMSLLRYSFINELKKLHGDKSKITACMVLKGLSDFEMTNDEWERDYLKVKSILSLRLPEETYRGIMNAEKAMNVKMPIDEVEKALEYLYDDVPKAECSP